MDIAELSPQQVRRLIHDMKRRVRLYFQHLRLTDLERMQRFVNGTITQRERNTYASTDPTMFAGLVWKSWRARGSS